MLWMLVRLRAVVLCLQPPDGSNLALADLMRVMCRGHANCHNRQGWGQKASDDTGQRARHPGALAIQK